MKAGKPRPGPDPQVDCLKAKLVDGAGTPLPGVQLIWSSRFMDGGMASDDKGIVKLAGGGVAIGGPPFMLRLAQVRGKERTYSGELDRVRGGVATVTLQPLHAITGTVKRGTEAVERFHIVGVGPGKRPYAYAGTVADGRYTVLLPRGACRVAIGTVDGELHTRTLDVQGPADAPLELK